MASNLLTNRRYVGLGSVKTISGPSVAVGQVRGPTAAAIFIMLKSTVVRRKRGKTSTTYEIKYSGAQEKV